MALRVQNQMKKAITHTDQGQPQVHFIKPETWCKQQVVEAMLMNIAKR